MQKVKSMQFYDIVHCLHAYHKAWQIKQRVRYLFVISINGLRPHYLEAFGSFEVLLLQYMIYIIMYQKHIVTII